MLHATHLISAVDSHTGGEPTRVITAGLPVLPGATMADKRAYLRKRLDHLRTALAREPRGHEAMVLAFLTPPVTPERGRLPGDVRAREHRGRDGAGGAVDGGGGGAVDDGVAGYAGRGGGVSGAGGEGAGSAYITGLSQFVLDPEDPLVHGAAHGCQ
jgi:proline racemase